MAPSFRLSFDRGRRYCDIIPSQEQTDTSRTKNGTTTWHNLLASECSLPSQRPCQLYQDYHEVLETTGAGTDWLEDTDGVYCH